MSTPTTPALPDQGVLAVIDMQVAFREEESQWHVPRYDEAAEHVKELAAAFGDRVVWTRFVRDPAEPGAWSSYYDQWSMFRVEESSPWWDLTLERAAEHPVISLPTFSKWGAELARHADLDTPLVICGVATDCCVLSTALGAIDAGRSVIVVTDACAAVSEQAQEQTLQVLGLLSPMVTLTTTAALLADVV